MTASQDKPGWKMRALLATIGALIVAYPLSYGPWLCYGDSRIPGRGIGSVIFAPAFFGLVFGPDWIVQPYVTYLERWNPGVRDSVRTIRRALGPGPTSD
jgi:hypothetical protein